MWEDWQKGWTGLLAGAWYGNDKARVGTWNPLKEEFEIKVGEIDGLELEVSGQQVLDRWKNEMGL
eukprot:6040493-Karenia_brevis.AAC.1